MLKFIRLSLFPIAITLGIISLTLYIRRNSLYDKTAKNKWLASYKLAIIVFFAYYGISGFSPKIVTTYNDNTTSSLSNNNQIVRITKNRLLNKALFIYGGDFGKTGPGPRAKTDALKSRNGTTTGTQNKGVVESFVMPALPSGKYHNYNNHFNGKGVFRESEPSSSIPESPSVRPGKPVYPPKNGRVSKKLDTQVKVRSEYQKGEIVIPSKKIKNWIREEERAECNVQLMNEKRFGQNLESLIKSPEEVLDGTHIHGKGQNCKVYLKDQILHDPRDVSNTPEKFMIIVDEEATPLLASSINNEEYNHLKETGEIYLNDLRRDTETLALNVKGKREASVLETAREQGFLDKYVEVRRPFNKQESGGDFVGKLRKDGQWINIDSKKIDGNGYRHFSTQAEDINQGIRRAFKRKNYEILCDITEAPSFRQMNILKDIMKDIPKEQLDKNITVLY